MRSLYQAGEWMIAIFQGEKMRLRRSRVSAFYLAELRKVT
jgi:hypothetical protein